MEQHNRAYRSLIRFYEAEAQYSASGSNADRSRLLATLHRDVVLYQPESLPYGGQWIGRNGFCEWLEAFVATWMDVTPLEPVFHSCGDAMLLSIVIMRATARSTGARIEMPMCQVIPFSDDLPIHWRNFAWDTAQMIAAMDPTLRDKVDSD
jgi:ketosteroid isomerase-like protein